MAGMYVECLPLPPSARQKLTSCGFINTRDLKDVGTLELASGANEIQEIAVFIAIELNIKPIEALEILKAAGYGNLSDKAFQGTRSAVEIYEKERSARKILTFCGDLDHILGGGIATGQITEFCGAPGVGKTQMGMQLAIDVQIPAAYGGLEAEALYIDTEGSFFVDRARAMAEAFVKHMKRLASNSKKPAQIAALADLTWEHVLDRIHYIRALDLSEQLAAMHGLEEFINEHPKVKVVVVDSITFHLRQDISDMPKRTRLLAQLSQSMMALASERDIAIVLNNHVTTKINGQQASIVPALGESWAHASTNRVILFWKEQQRMAFLYKSPSLPAKSAEYCVTREGVRGLRPSQKRARDQK